MQASRELELQTYYGAGQEVFGRGERQEALGLGSTAWPDDDEEELPWRKAESKEMSPFDSSVDREPAAAAAAVNGVNSSARNRRHRRLERRRLNSVIFSAPVWDKQIGCEFVKSHLDDFRRAIIFMGLIFVLLPLVFLLCVSLECCCYYERMKTFQPFPEMGYLRFKNKKLMQAHLITATARLASFIPSHLLSPLSASITPTTHTLLWLLSR